MSEDDDLLDEALGALREESRDPSEATLERILDSLDGDHVLDEAVAALRAEPMYAESDATLARIHASLAQRPAAGGDALDETLDEATDALRATRTPTRSSRWPMAAAAVVLLAVGLGAPTAWAWSTGRLPALLASIGLGPSVEPPRAPSPTRPPTPVPAPAPTAPAPTAPAPTAPAPTAQAPAPAPPPAPAPATAAASRRGRVPPVVVEAPVDEPPAADAPLPDPDSPETRTFAAAHEAHFRGGDPAEALRRWDAYLAQYPRGRFELEARYNRALALVRLGRRAEARAALAPFAEGAHGSYRRHEAERLVAAIDAAADAESE